MAHAINGLIVASSMLAVVGAGPLSSPLRACAIVSATVAIFCIAHAYAAWTQIALGTNRPVGRTAVRAALLSSTPALLPLSVLLAPVLLAATSLWSLPTALWISYGEALAVLAAVGLMTGRRRHYPVWRISLLVLLSATVGCLVILFKQLAH